MASNDYHDYRHTVTGKVERMTEDAASVFPEYLILVEDGAKDMAPELFKPGTVEEYRERQNRGSRYEAPPEVDPADLDNTAPEPVVTETAPQPAHKVTTPAKPAPMKIEE